MSEELIVFIVVFALMFIVLLLLHTERIGRQFERAHSDVLLQWQDSREQWDDDRRLMLEQFAVERQQLLDRIQAPSFGEFKQAEIKTIKAQQGIKDPVQLEPL